MPNRFLNLSLWMFMFVATTLIFGGRLSGEIPKLSAYSPVTLGYAASGAAGLCASSYLGEGRWVVVWLDSSGRMIQALGSKGGETWAPPEPILDNSSIVGFTAIGLTGDELVGWQLAARTSDGTWRIWQRPTWAAKWEPTNNTSRVELPNESGLPLGALASTRFGPQRVALRSGKRVLGITPRYPSAGVVVCTEVEGAWRDLGFADEMPDELVESASVAAADGRWIAAYIAPVVAGKHVCRVIQGPITPLAAKEAAWRPLPDYPQKPGMAGLQAGSHKGVLIAAGGANYPDGTPKPGGKKWYDTIYVWLPLEGVWRSAGHLPEPRAYGAAVSVPEGVLIIGGDNADKIFRDSLLLTWDGERVNITAGPPLPRPLTGSSATVLSDSVYLAGGSTGVDRTSCSDFLRLDLTRWEKGWQALATWPGPARALAVMAAVDGAVYLISGLDVQTTDNGPMQPNYLCDAYRYRPGSLWEKLPSPPWSTTAAPSPSPVTNSPFRVFVLGGVDGRQSGHLPNDARLPNDILYFDVIRNEWRLWPEWWPDSVVTGPAVQLGSEWIVPSGEILSGIRTTHTWSWQIESSR